MNSKEALEKIKWNVLASTLVNKEEHLDLCEQLEKDLEVLELLTKHTFVYTEEISTTKHTYYYLNNREVDSETYNTIKEWLENE